MFELSDNLKQCKNGHDYELYDYGFMQTDRREYVLLHLRCLRCKQEVGRKPNDAELEIITKMESL